MPSNDEPEPEGPASGAIERGLHGEKPPSLYKVPSAALFGCTRLGELAVLAELLDSGVDPNAVYSVTSPEDHGEFELTALKMAADAGQLDAVRLLLDRGADPNVVANGFTLLMTAASGGFTKCRTVPLIELLLERGAALDRTTDIKSMHRTLQGLHPAGWTAFHFACSHGDPDVVEVLVRAGCDTSAKNMDGKNGKQVCKSFF